MSDERDSLAGAPDRQAVLAVVGQFWRAMDARDAAAAEALVTSDIAIIDAFAPYVWSGAGASSAWLRDLWAFCDSTGISVAQTTLGEASQATVDGQFGYVVVPAVMEAARDGDLTAQHGLITAALRHEAGSWRIAGLCWAGR